jgi:hypothetical protein
MNGVAGTIGRTRQARGLILFLCFAGAVWILSAWILDASSQMLVIGGMGLALLIILVGTLHDWRVGLYLFIGWLLFEDLARKYMGNSTILFFGKDVLAAITICSLLLARQRRRIPWFRPPFLVPLALFFGLALIQMFNSVSPSVLYGLLGLKLYFFYVPLMYCGYALLHSNKDLERFLVYNIVIGFVICGLGIAQSILGLGFLNPNQLAPALQELGNLTRESPLTHQVLAAPTSVFVSAGRFDYYVIFVVILALGAQAYLLLTHRRRAAWGLLGVGIAVVAAMQSGSRGSFLWVGISILVLSAGFLWGVPRSWGHGHRLIKAFRRAALVSAAGLSLMIVLFPNKIDATWAFYSETLSPTSSASELTNRAWDYPLTNLEYAFDRPRWPIGYGTGTASLGTQYVSKLLGQPPPDIWIENGWGVLILEMGILGPILWLIWTGALLVAAWGVVRQLRQTVYFPLALAFFWYLFLLLGPFTYAGMSPYQNYVMNAYCWILVGVLFRLPHLARSEQAISVRAGAPQMVNAPAFVEER